MVNFPWRNDPAEDEQEGTPADEESSGEPLLTCTFQDGSLEVHEDRIVIERARRSKFDDKEIAMDQVRGITYSKRLVISYLQIDQVDVENSRGSLLSTPVDENTLHFGRGKRNCAKRARDEVQARATLE